MVHQIYQYFLGKFLKMKKEVTGNISFQIIAVILNQIVFQSKASVGAEDASRRAVEWEERRALGSAGIRTVPRAFPRDTGECGGRGCQA